MQCQGWRGWGGGGGGNENRRESGRKRHKGIKLCASEVQDCGLCGTVWYGTYRVYLSACTTVPRGTEWYGT